MAKLWLIALLTTGLNSVLFGQVHSLLETKKTSLNSLVEEVSLIQLIATPERYHGKFVQVVGYMNLEFEGSAIYLHKEDFDQRLSRNGLWVEFSEAIRKQKILKNYSKQYVIIIGTFDMESKGHLGLFSGEITNIWRLDTWIHKR